MATDFMMMRIPLFGEDSKGPGLYDKQQVAKVQGSPYGEEEDDDDY